jgi:hypothetical protein
MNVVTKSAADRRIPEDRAVRAVSRATDVASVPSLDSCLDEASRLSRSLAARAKRLDLWSQQGPELMRFPRAFAAPFEDVERAVAALIRTRDAVDPAPSLEGDR